jgi:hypothetical protein
MPTLARDFEDDTKVQSLRSPWPPPLETPYVGKP